MEENIKLYLIVQRNKIVTSKYIVILNSYLNSYFIHIHNFINCYYHKSSVIHIAGLFETRVLALVLDKLVEFPESKNFVKKY